MGLDCDGEFSPFMYVTRLRLENIRCFEQLTITFDPPESSILVIGDNGDGKSTILRSLAMGLCDESSAAALFRELPGEFVRRGSGKHSGVIEVDLADGDSSHYRIVTKIRPLKTFERVEQRLYHFRDKKRKIVRQDDFPWDRIFASAYGAGIRTQGTADYDSYLPVDAVYPLFRYDTPLQNPELVIRRLIDKARRENGRYSKTVLQELKVLLKDILQLEQTDQIDLTPTGIVVAGPWGEAELGALGDGYRATVTWVLDLLSWWFLKREQDGTKEHPTDVQGIVLLDEIEQHLHPRWQRNIVHLLTNSFPKLQFIATTHSPLVASGCRGIPVHRLAPGQHTIEQPFGWLAEDVYQMMGLTTSRAKPFFDEDLETFRQLELKRLHGNATDAELTQLHSLQQQFDQLLPGTDPLRLTTEIKNIRESLKRISRKTR